MNTFLKFSLITLTSLSAISSQANDELREETVILNNIKTSHITTCEYNAVVNVTNPFTGISTPINESRIYTIETSNSYFSALLEPSLEDSGAENYKWATKPEKCSKNKKWKIKKQFAYYPLSIDDLNLTNNHLSKNMEYKTVKYSVQGELNISNETQKVKTSHSIKVEKIAESHQQAIDLMVSFGNIGKVK